jgi:hypothetical protein
LDIEILHTDEYIVEGEAPAYALRTKHSASIVLAIKLVKQGRAAAVISNGPTGGVIAAALMHANIDSILNDMNYFGFLFESLAARDLRVYAQALDGDIFHYHDKNELEADLVIRLHDGRWAPVEVKLGSREIEIAAANLIKLQNKIDTDKAGQPSFKMVLTGGQFAYKRQDGVIVVPIACLKA